MTTNVLLRARPVWTAAMALRHPDTGGCFMRSFALGDLHSAVDCRDGLWNWRTALALEQTGNGPKLSTKAPWEIEPEPVA